MKLVVSKIAKLQDSFFKLKPNGSHEASIFLDSDIVKKIDLEAGVKLVLKIDFDNIYKGLCFAYSFPKDLYKEKEIYNRDFKWFSEKSKLIEKLFNNSTTIDYSIETKLQSGNRFYLIKLKTKVGFNIRDLIIENYTKLLFKRDDDGNNWLFLDYSLESTEDTESIEDTDIDYSIQQKIFYGAPGTGKSYKVDGIVKELDEKYKERITFHPEFDYASFVGCYKPISEYNEDKREYEIQYKFVAQSFTKIYKRAWLDLDNHYYLVIEEINRGNCAEIFGDIFQLLDRGSNYTVSPSKELKEYLEGKDGFNNKNHKGIINGLKLPPNISILATMNTSDQSLFPMDSAFKRRWDWEYIPINYDEKNADGKDNISHNYKVKLSDDKTFKWIDFIKNVNSRIEANKNLGMDKCIGNYFIKPKKTEISLDEFVNKAIFYLWSDVFKDEEDNSIFNIKDKENVTYGNFFPINDKASKLIELILEELEVKVTEKSEE